MNFVTDLRQSVRQGGCVSHSSHSTEFSAPVSLLPLLIMHIENLMERLNFHTQTKNYAHVFLEEESSRLIHHFECRTEENCLQKIETQLLQHHAGRLIKAIKIELY